MQIPMLKGDKIDSDVDYRDALPVNMTAINHPVKGAQSYMFQWYGLTKHADGAGVDRGVRWVSRTDFDGHYRVSGTSLIKVGSDGSVTNLGSVPGSEQVRIAYSFNNIAIVADKKLYYYNPTDGLRQITDPDIGSPIDVVWIDGVFVLTDGEDVYHSTLADEEAFNPLDFGNAQFRPDASFGLGVSEDNELVVFGVKTVEYFENTGGANFLFTANRFKAVKRGIVGTHCKFESAGKWFCISRREETGTSVVSIQGGSSDKVSSREVDKILSRYSDDALSDSIIESFYRDAVWYVVVHLPEEVLLFNQNIAETMGFSLAWSILKSDVLGSRPYRAKNFVRVPDSEKWFCGDKFGSNIGYLDEGVATHYGDIAEWILFTPLIRLETLSVDKLEVETIPGFSPDEDATVFLSATENGLWYTPEEIEEYAENLNHFQRFIFRRLGYVASYMGWKLRGASRSRMSFALFNVEAS